MANGKFDGESHTQLDRLNITKTLRLHGVPIDIQAYEFLLEGKSLATSQQPSALDTPMQIEFGAGSGTASDPVQILANGDIVINKAGQYVLDFFLQLGRSGAAGVSKVFGRLTVNNVQPAASDSVSALLDNANIIIPEELTTVLTLPAGVVLRAEIARDSTGTNFGGLFQQVSALGWNPAPCATVNVFRLRDDS